MRQSSPMPFPFRLLSWEVNVNSGRFGMPARVHDFVAESSK